MSKSKYRKPKPSDRIDNDQYTMKDAVCSLLEESNNKAVDIASAYFRLSGITEIKESLTSFIENSEELPAMRWLFSTRLNDDMNDLFLDEVFLPDNAYFNQIIQWIKDKKIEIKVFVGKEYIETNDLKKIEFLHGKAYLFSESRKSTTGHVLIGSSNFTQGGLVKNRELNIYSNDTWSVITEWFNEIWENYSIDYSRELINELSIEKERAADIWAEVQKKRKYTSADYVYYQLGKYYGEKQDKSLQQRILSIEKNLSYPERQDGTKYFVHQRQGIEMVYENLIKLNSVVLADGVGLGKTLEAASVIRLFLEDLRQAGDKRKVLILASGRLVEQWHSELRNVGIKANDFEIITRQSFAILDEGELKHYSDYYALVVIDEAHEGFLKIKNKAYRNMKFLIETARIKKSLDIYGLLLTATPWNNSREDVIRLGTLFLNNEKIEKEKAYYSYVINGNLSPMFETKSRKDINEVAYKEFWKDIFIQRTRRSLSSEKHLSEKYPTRVFPLEENEEEPYRISYSLEVSIALTEILDKLIQLKLPYQDTIIQYFLDSHSNVVLRQRQQLLRRADSSNIAFDRSLENIRKRLKEFEFDVENLQDESLREVKKYFKSTVDKRFSVIDTTPLTLELDLDEDIDFIDDLSQAKITRLKLIDDTLTEDNLSEYLNRILNDIHEDMNNLEKIIDRWRQISIEDKKLDAIMIHVKNELKLGHKVILFTEFVDTARYYYEYLMKDKDIRMHGLGYVVGQEASANNESCDKDDVLGRFSPHSKKYKEELVPGKELNLLIGSDAISTGQNLQDASVVMTIELPYNPMRLEQRIGRIDRPKQSEQNEIFVYAFPSDEIVNAEIALLERYQAKAEGVSEDTNSDVNLPFMKEIKRNGLKIALDNAEETEIYFDDLSPTIKVSEQEAKYKLFDFYNQNNGFEDDYLSKVELYPGHSFSYVNSKSVFLIFAEYRDLNGKVVQKTEYPLIVDESFSNLSLVDSEEIVNLSRKNYAHSVSELPTDIAKNIIMESENSLDNFKGNLVKVFNDNNTNKIKLEDSTILVRELVKELNIKKRDYREEFKRSNVDPKIFNLVINSLPKRNFSKKQNEFFGSLKGNNGKLSNKLIREKIWFELPSFIRIFEQEAYHDSQDVFNNADVEKTIIRIETALHQLK
ncbi:phospholipase D-like domain-containing protein [Enterococcus hulanensis]|uniref:SNF2-related protein n=1 Tax=Enterococcus hulanensis TaxID=2559929 RepID=UPI002890E50F|nr:SNF2-related protein [Enterococcus hulanensis]MDT2661214.1 phospholipase D-like domain-containing protein [Enterococcus hulanensis]